MGESDGGWTGSSSGWCDSGMMGIWLGVQLNSLLCFHEPQEIETEAGTAGTERV